jgi:two-component system phosphate regulon sensor histidine kinase PhoR
MKSHWSAEYSRLLVLAVVILIVGVLTQAWIITILLGFSVYIAWHFFQLRKLERWLTGGFKDEDTPDGDGVWEYIVQQTARRRRVEKSQKKRYQQSFTRLNEVIAALPYATIVLDNNLDILWSNKIAEKLLGIRVEKDRGQRITNLIRSLDFIEFINEVSDGENQRIELRSPTDEKKMLMVRLIPFGKGEFLLIARDITERVELQRTRKLFVANASHELRTPLSVVSGYLELLEQEPDISQDMQDAVKNAMIYTDRMRTIIEDMLTLAVLENRRLKSSEGECVNVDEKLKQFVSSLAESGQLDQHEILIDSDPDLMLFGVDLEIDSVIGNLIKNALKYTPAGSTIRTKWYKNELEEACLVVADDGQGIPKEHLSHITERFYRIDEGRDRKNGGTGLGLSIVKHVVERHSGELLVESKLGEGATFIAVFPEKRIIKDLELMCYH